MASAQRPWDLPSQQHVIGGPHMAAPHMSLWPLRKFAGFLSWKQVSLLLALDVTLDFHVCKSSVKEMLDGQ
jgi:hypothetical protein